MTAAQRIAAFFFGAARFLAATLFATFFFVRELDFLAFRDVGGSKFKLKLEFDSRWRVRRAAYSNKWRAGIISSIVAKSPLEGAYGGRMLCKSHGASPSLGTRGNTWGRT